MFDDFRAAIVFYRADDFVFMVGDKFEKFRACGFIANDRGF